MAIQIRKIRIKKDKKGYTMVDHGGGGARGKLRNKRPSARGPELGPGWGKEGS